MTIQERIKGMAGCGLMLAIIAGACGIHGTAQAFIALFGAIYGGLWLQDKEWR